MAGFAAVALIMSPTRVRRRGMGAIPTYPHLHGTALHKPYNPLRLETTPSTAAMSGIPLQLPPEILQYVRNL